MAIRVGSLLIEVAANIARATNDLNVIKNRVGKFARDVNTTMGKVKTAFAGIFSVVAAKRIATSLQTVYDETIKTTDAIIKFSTRIGIGTEALSGLQYAAEQSGVASTTFNMALQRMTRRLAEAADGTGEAKGALRELGLDAKRLSTLPIEQQFLAITDALKPIASQADRVRLVFKLFDSEGVSMLQIMAHQREGIEDLMEKAHRLGITIDKDMRQTVEEAAAASVRLKGALEGVARTIVRDVGPSITSFKERLADVLEWMVENKPAWTKTLEEYFPKPEAMKIQTWGEDPFVKWLSELLKRRMEGIRREGEVGGFAPLPKDWFRKSFGEEAIGGVEPFRPEYDVKILYETASEEAMKKYNEIHSKILAMTGKELQAKKLAIREELGDRLEAYAMAGMATKELYDSAITELNKYHQKLRDEARKTEEQDARERKDAYDTVKEFYAKMLSEKSAALQAQETALGAAFAMPQAFDERQLLTYWEAYKTVRQNQIDMDAKALKAAGASSQQIVIYQQAQNAALENMYKDLFVRTKVGTQEWIDDRIKMMRLGGATEEEVLHEILELHKRYAKEFKLTWQDALDIGQKQFELEMGSMFQRIADIQYGATRSMADNMTNMFMDWTTGTVQFGDAFRSMINNIIQDVMRLTTQKMISEPLANMFSSGLSSIFGGTGDFFKKLFKMHSGGMVKDIPYAPSIAGDEIPVLAQRGELIVPEDVVKQMPKPFWKKIVKMHEGGIVGTDGTELHMPETPERKIIKHARPVERETIDLLPVRHAEKPWAGLSSIDMQYPEMPERKIIKHSPIEIREPIEKEISKSAISKMPKMHDGGIVGETEKSFFARSFKLQPEEVPIIAKKREVVIPEHVTRLFPKEYWQDLLSMHEGGFVGGQPVGRPGRTSRESYAPQITINAINKDLPPVQVKQGDIRKEFGRMVVDVYLERQQRDRNFRRANETIRRF